MSEQATYSGRYGFVVLPQEDEFMAFARSYVAHEIAYVARRFGHILCECPRYYVPIWINENEFVKVSSNDIFLVNRTLTLMLTGNKFSVGFLNKSVYGLVWQLRPDNRMLAAYLHAYGHLAKKEFSFAPHRIRELSRSFHLVMARFNGDFSADIENYLLLMPKKFNVLAVVFAQFDNDGRLVKIIGM